MNKCFHSSTWVHPQIFDRVCVAHFVSFLCCPIMCLYVLTSVLWCPLRFPYKNDVLFVFTSSCLIYVICACLHIVVCFFVLFVFVLCPMSCVPTIASFSGLSIFGMPRRCFLTFIRQENIFVDVWVRSLNMWLLTIDLLVLLLPCNLYCYIYISCCFEFRKQRKLVFGE